MYKSVLLLSQKNLRISKVPKNWFFFSIWNVKIYTDFTVLSTSESSSLILSSNMALGSFILLLLDWAIWRLSLQLISSRRFGVMVLWRSLVTTSAAAFFQASTITFACRLELHTKYLYAHKCWIFLHFLFHGGYIYVHLFRIFWF